MLIHSKKLYDDRLAALDGEIGRVKDLYFDDKNWVVRYVVADTGSWLTGRLVLLSPHAFGRLDEVTSALQVNLTRAQIEHSPAIDAHKPVSRQYEIDYFRYYGWPVYWNGGGMWGMASCPAIVAPSKAEIEAGFRMHHRDDKHLQSAHALGGYNIEASDGTLGFMRGLLVDDRTWAIAEIAVDAGHWYAEKEIRIATSEIERISYEESRIFVRLTKADIRRTLENRVATAEPVSATD
jgi:hypothetical protein